MSIFIDIEKKLGNFQLRVNVSAGDEVLALLGASGCGKSMTLKCIAGIEKPDRGKIVVDGITLFDSEKHINLSPQKRRTGLLFQNYALFPNMTVEQNLRTGTKRTSDKNLREEKIREALERFGLSELKDHLPAQLSGGQQQRTALARILLSEPNILLLDEPFSALDSHLRFRMEQEVKELIEGFGKTVVLVSHDRDEVFRMSDQIAVMNQGEVEVYGSRHDVFADPKTKTACMLTGCKNISRARVVDAGHILAEDWDLLLEAEASSEDTQYVGIRQHDVELSEDGISCKVVSVTENPFSYTVMLQKDQAEPFGIELDKEVWKQQEAKELKIRMPKEKLLLLQ